MMLPTALLLVVAAAWGAGTPDPQSAGGAARGAHPTVAAPEDGASCVACHKDVTRRSVPHAPAAAESCASCHAVATNGPVTSVTLEAGATRGNLIALCAQCHEDIGTHLKAPHGHVPAASGDCGTCHDPHGSSTPALLLAPQAELCGTCHDEIAQALARKSVHGPARAACGICHDPHAARQAKLLQTDTNALCRACHATGGGRPSPDEVSSVLGRPVAGDRTEMVARARGIVLDGLGQRGHPVAGHPVSGVPDPTDPARTMSCISCHDPHGSSAVPLLRGSVSGQMELCIECHK